MMHTDALIIGGGLSGLAAAWQLQGMGKTVRVIEARDRIGGRIFAVPAGQHVVDAGPSWFWPGQPIIAQYLNHFGIEHFPQFATGDLLHQAASGAINRYPDFAPMANARRIRGGVSRLIDALADDLHDGVITLQCKATSIARTDEVLTVDTVVQGTPETFTADHVAVAVPPRLAAGLEMTPALPAGVQKALRDIPTWMAGHAKFIALYATPFWRTHGLSGDIMSQRGPLAEVHDASPYEDEHFSGPYALFGFVGIDAKTRKTMGEQALISAACAQLRAVFGTIAPEPVSAVLQDWSSEPYTATPDDHVPLSGHPQYGPVGDIGEPWGSRLHYISTETSSQNGGLLEGALERATAFAAAVKNS